MAELPPAAKSQIRILHATTVHPRLDIRIFWREAVFTAGLEGFSVTLAVADGKGDEVRCGVRIMDLGKLPSSRLLRVFHGWTRLFPVVWRGDFDLLQIHDPELLPVAAVARLIGRRVIFDMHENVPAQIVAKAWIPSPLRGLVSLLYRMIELLILPWIAVIFAEKSYRRAYPRLKHATEVLNLPDLSIMPDAPERPAISDPPFVVGYLGAITTLRGVLEAIDAITLLRDAGHQVHFLCVGAVDEGVATDPRFKKALAEGWLASHGWVSAPDCWSIIARQADCGIATLLPVPNYLESMPTKILEYMALGLPVVASDFPLYQEIMNETGAGLVADPTSPSDIAEKLEALIASPEKCREFGKSGRAAVHRKFNARAEGDNLVRFYQQLVNPTPILVEDPS